MIIEFDLVELCKKKRKSFSGVTVFDIGCPVRFCFACQSIDLNVRRFYFLSFFFFFCYEWIRNILFLFLCAWLGHRQIYFCFAINKSLSVMLWLSVFSKTIFVTWKYIRLTHLWIGKGNICIGMLGGRDDILSISHFPKTNISTSIPKTNISKSIFKTYISTSIS